jgi:hypothetical protein
MRSVALHSLPPRSVPIWELPRLSEFLKGKSCGSFRNFALRLESVNNIISIDLPGALVYYAKCRIALVGVHGVISRQSDGYRMIAVKGVPPNSPITGIDLPLP